MSRFKQDLEPLETRIGHRFVEADLLTTALTHVSVTVGARRETYQRLEFLGDRVLGLVIAEMLYATFPEAEEGELSRRLADLVRKESCAEVALEWGVGPFVRLGESERQIGTTKKAILGDVCESIIGAVFLDAGYTVAQQVIVKAFDARMRSPRRPLRDAKTVLQEWAQSRGHPTPLYREICRCGPDHAPEFTISVCIPGYADAQAKGPSKRLAEQAAAAHFIEREGIQEKQKGAA
ncbi:ribonuclease III [Beijerinckia indica]|uniref:Ribonuclease 3 n=1 Tax=Beijerinckia indica subsp. indica (strain ATCC 9039 / DSM 1715 / NCIMB 8712) TaxID=395963 RepID=B2II96_BEII9|nr:ribonuclease III [Beijerinckia indica]ACB96050.1 Ribonuclease III [Beijerinckia indica subsp. indica ATCC 9039]